VNTDVQNLKRHRTAPLRLSENPGAVLCGLEFYRNRVIMSNTSHDGYESFMTNIEAGAVDVVVAKNVCLTPDAARPFR
jgi:hypothetical protein